MREIEPAVIVDDVNLGIVQHVAGEIAQPLVGAEGREHRGIALRHGDAREFIRSATEVEMPPPNCTTKVSGACLIR